MLGINGLLNKGIVAVSVLALISLLASYFIVDITHNKEIAAEYTQIRNDHLQTTQSLIQQGLEKLTLAAEEIYLLGQWERESMQSVVPSLEKLWPTLEITFGLSSMVIKQESQERIFGRIDETMLDKLYAKTMASLSPQHEFICRPRCSLTSAVPVFFADQQAVLIVSADIASSIYDVYSVTRSEMVVLQESPSDEHNSTVVKLQDKSFAVSMQTDGEFANALFALLDKNSNPYLALNQGVQFRVFNKNVYAWLNQIENETDILPIIFIRDVDKLLSQREQQKINLLLIIGAIAVSILVVISLLAFGPIKRLGTLKHAMTLIGENQYSDAIKTLGHVKTGRQRDEIDALEREFKRGIEQLANYERKLEESQQGLRRLATIDTTTGLLNRNAFLEHMQALAGSLSENETCLLFIDLDGFKQVNDNLGHIVGDMLLEQVGSRIKPVSSDHIKVYRIGGDEFLVAVPNKKNVDDLGAFAQAIVDLFNTPFDIQEKSISVTASIGVAIATQHTQSHIDLLKHADIAMYRAKEQGKDKYCFFSEEMGEQIKLHYIIENQFLQAMADKQLSLAFQPIIDIKTGKLIKLEALSRWIHPEIGFIRPDIFINVLEETNHIKALSEWLIRQAAIQIKALDALGLSDVVVSINISGSQVSDIDSIALFMVECSRAQIEYSRLELEITETSLIADFKKAQDWITKVNKMGFRIAIDDFGTGYSSLSYLTSFPFDCVKLDRSLLIDVEENERTRNIVGSITDMIHAMNVTVVAEGIETASHLAAIESLGCDYVQGYYYARPLSAKDLAIQLTTYIEDQKWVPMD